VQGCQIDTPRQAKVANCKRIIIGFWTRECAASQPNEPTMYPCMVSAFFIQLRWLCHLSLIRAFLSFFHGLGQLDHRCSSYEAAWVGRTEFVGQTPLGCDAPPARRTHEPPLRPADWPRRRCVRRLTPHPHSRILPAAASLLVMVPSSIQQLSTSREMVHSDSCWLGARWIKADCSCQAEVSAFCNFCRACVFEMILHT
jgi:hypothetical protein